MTSNNIKNINTPIETFGEVPIQEPKKEYRVISTEEITLLLNSGKDHLLFGDNNNYSIIGGKIYHSSHTIEHKKMVAQFNSELERGEIMVKVNNILEK